MLTESEFQELVQSTSAPEYRELWDGINRLFADHRALSEAIANQCHHKLIGGIRYCAWTEERLVKHCTPVNCIFLEVQEARR